MTIGKKEHMRSTKFCELWLHDTSDVTVINYFKLSAEQISLWDQDDSMNKRLKQVNMIEINLVNEYDRSSEAELLNGLFSLMDKDNIRTINLCHNSKTTSLDEFLEDVSAVFGLKPRSLKFSGYQISTTVSIPKYFHLITTLHVRDTKPMHLTIKRNGIEEYIKGIEYFFIDMTGDKGSSLGNSLTWLISEHPYISMEDNTEYVKCILGNSDTLRELYLMLDSIERFVYFIEHVIDVLLEQAPGIQKIGVDYDEKVTYNSERIEANINRISLKVAGVKYIENILAVVTRARPIEFVSLNVGKSSEIKALKERLELHQSRLKHVELKTTWDSKNQAILVDVMFHAILEIPVLIIQADSGDYVQRVCTDKRITKVVAAIKSERFDDVLSEDVRSVELELVKMDETTLSSYGERLFQIPVAIDVSLHDDNFELLAWILQKIEKTEKETPAYKPWTGIKTLSAYVSIEDELLLQQVINLTMFPSLRTITFKVRDEDDVEVIKNLFINANWIIKSHGNTVQGVYMFANRET